MSPSKCRVRVVRDSNPERFLVEILTLDPKTANGQLWEIEDERTEEETRVRLAEIGAPSIDSLLQKARENPTD
jgi:hypothetical protein